MGDLRSTENITPAFDHPLLQLTAGKLADSHTCAIQDYGIIGDCHSAALISKGGSLEWLCWPQFDSTPLFAGLLDSKRGGFWRIRPAEPFLANRKYVDNTNILQTTFQTVAGAALLTDLMPVSSEEYKRTTLVPDRQVIRQLECLSGELEMEIEFVPRKDFGMRAATVRDRGKLGIRVQAGSSAFWLRSNVPFSLDDCSAHAHVRLKNGQRLQFSLTYSQDSPAVLAPLGDVMLQSIVRSIEWWQEWARRAKYDGPYREAVVRSALALKLLAYAPSGAIVAAATTSLPERIGGDLNWDYRYCWLRDASLTIRAFLGLGYQEEAASFMDWMLVATRLSRPQLRIMYDVYGDRPPRERKIESLRGYRNSRPVRVGNGARDQLQLDVYGEVLDAAAQYCSHGGQFSREMQRVLIGFGRYVVKHWESADEGIWEPRGGRQHHTHSRLLCWTALDRLVSLAEQGFLRDAPIDEFRRERDSIRKQICQRAWNSRLQSYVSTLDGDGLDSSLLLLSWYGFEKADSERMKKTYSRLRRDLGAGNGLLYRYRTDPAEGAFALCSFWETEYLLLGGGSLDEAQRLFRDLLSYRNDLGLYGEEIDPASGDALGNFPQAFTHVGLVNAALSLRDRMEGAEPLPHRPKDAAETDSAETTR